VKRRDPWHGANAPPTAVAVPALSGQDADRTHSRVLTWFAGRWRNHQPKRAEKPHSKSSGRKALDGPALGAPSRGCRLPDAVLHGKRSHSASQQGRPAPFGHWISSEAFQLAWAGGCATGPQTRSRHDCVCGPRLDHLARGLPPLLAVRSPRATGLASSLSGCVWLTGQRCRL